MKIIANATLISLHSEDVSDVFKLGKLSAALTNARHGKLGDGQMFVECEPADLLQLALRACETVRR